MTPLDPVPSDDVLPTAVDVAVVGGGIVGVSAALALAQRGVKVALLEKGRVAGEQSGRNWGFVRQQGRSMAELPLARLSLGLWDGLSAEIGEDAGFRRTGVLYVTDQPDAVERWEAYVSRARPLGIGSRMLTGTEASAMLPGCPRTWLAGLHTPEDGCAEPAMAAPAIARAARRHGATIHQNCAVRGFDRTAGRVSGVFTERGRIAAQAVIVASGAWSSMLLRPLGFALPQLAVRATVLRTEPVAAPFMGGLTAPDFSMRRRLDGGYSVAISGRWTFDLVPDAFRWVRSFLPAFAQQRRNLRLRIGGRFLEAWREARPRGMDVPSPFEARREWDPAPDPKVLRDAMARMVCCFPALAGVRMAASWAGMIDITPDATPAIGPVPGIDGLIVATGFSGHGFALGPGAGLLAAELATGGTPPVDPAPFTLDRLTMARIGREVV